MEPLNATAIERDNRQPKAQQMLGFADDEYVNLTTTRRTGGPPLVLNSEMGVLWAGLCAI